MNEFMTNVLPDILKNIFGAGSAAQIISTLFWAYLTAFTNLLYQANKRDPLSARTPYHFSLNFLWCDNAKRILRSVILIFIFIRFSKELLGVEITMYGAVIIGFSTDKLSQYIKQKASGYIGNDDADKKTNNHG